MKPKTMRRMFLREAAVTLAVARLAVHFVPASQLLNWASRPPRWLNRFAIGDVGWVAWAVDTMGAKWWMNAKCFPRALAAQVMLQRRGIASRLCMGDTREGEAAHAWLELAQRTIVAGAEAPRVTRLIEFGGERR